jgi:hypothetical protein
MIKKEFKEIIKQQVRSKVSQLSTWKQVRYQGGRLYYETTIITNEISDYPTEIKIYYLETLLNQEFIIQDNLPSEAPDITSELKNWIQTTIARLKIGNLKETEDFHDKDIDEISLDKLNIDANLKQILLSRIDEIKKCIKSKAYLSVLFLTGSVMEGLLLGYALQYPQQFNSSPSAPKDESNKAKTLNNWTLSDFINVASQLGLLNEDVKKHSHTLRDFRNYIHPKEQLKSLFNPDEGTSKINWHVLKACVIQLNENEKRLKNK